MKIAILGTGRMGAWFAGRLSAGNRVAVYDEDRKKTEGLEGVEILTRLPEVGAFAPEMLINAVSLEETVRTFRDVEGYLSKDCVLCDMTSVKQEVRAYYETCPFRFVSIHPMFGPTFADMSALKEEHAVVIKESDKWGADFFRAFFSGFGLNLVEYSFEEHDRMMAYSLTIPFVSSLTFAACLDAKAVPGTTFKKHMAIAEGLLSEDDHLLSEILFNPHSLRELDRITSRLEFLKHVIKAKDYEEAHAFFKTLRKNIAS